jgi:hypothetical protein
MPIGTKSVARAASQFLAFTSADRLPFGDHYGTLFLAAGDLAQGLLTLISWAATSYCGSGLGVTTAVYPSLHSGFLDQQQVDMESLFSSAGPPSDTGARVKVMRWPANLRLGHTTLEGKAIQISGSGVGLLLTRSVREGEVGLVRVNAFINGASVRLQARGSVVCCACVGMDGFRISLRFLELDEDAQDALDKLLHAR